MWDSRVFRDGADAGRLEIREDGLYYAVSVRVDAAREVLRCCAVWPGGECWLGVPAPDGSGALTLLRRVPRDALPQPAETHAELLDAAWEPWQGSIGGMQPENAWRRGCEIAMLFRADELPPFFCCCSYRRIDGRDCLVVQTDAAGEPTLSSSSPTGQWSEPNTSA